MTTRARTSVQSARARERRENAKAEMQGNQPKVAIKAFKDRRASNGEKKMALQQDVDKLRKRLRQEENIHRALERAFNRPLGVLPRLPPYLPPSTLELLAEVAVLEEEVVRLEEQVVHFRQDLYQEAVYLSSSKRHMENLADSDEPTANKSSELEQPAVLTRTLSKIIQLQSLSDSGQGKANQSLSDSTKNNSATLQWKAHLVRTPVKRPPSDSKPVEKPSDPTVLKLEQSASLARQLSKRMQLQSFSDDVQVKENQSVSDSTKNNKATLQRKAHLVRTPVKRPPSDSSPVEKPSDPQRLQVESRLQEQDGALALNLAASDEQSVGHDGPNRISEEMVKCLSSIILRMSPIKSRGAHESDESTDLQDPYRICSAVGRRDIGPYKHLLSIEANSVFPRRTSNSLFLLHQLKILFERLSYVKLQNLNHQEKLAFWINIYNSCMMNAFLQHGIPESPSMVVELMRKETINVGGYLLNAITIEHFILRLPYHLKYTFPKGAKNDELTLRSMFGLELSEPLVTFALCCGSWSSPAVRVYTAAHVENELEVAKREYLRAAIGISSTRLVIPKLLDWYLLDFAKDLDSLLDWICLQLPSEVGKEAINYLERAKGERVKHFVQVMPYDFRFRYLISST